MSNSSDDDPKRRRHKKVTDNTGSDIGSEIRIPSDFPAPIKVRPRFQPFQQDILNKKEVYIYPPLELFRVYLA